MYVVTFYSFKGGVGRTLALANVGLDLARTGRRVLLVDFDLEAPGIHTFRLLKPKQAHGGVVDYISNYLAARSSPDVRNYVYEALGVGQHDGRLWVMPAGKSDSGYARKLASINWHALYKEHDGFIMFEDMKAQWDSCFEPDYVLIDSRTGHTDIGGICTRQLPNAVVILFFPNEQNLVGLKPIVSSINAQDATSKRATQMHYVMSNVPDLDDEDEILANLETQFQEDLGYKSLAAIIHRYDSLLLLQQSLFIAERPKSRLAREYRVVTQEITEQNIEDREAVIQSLTRRRGRSLLGREFIKNEEDRIDEVARVHAKDGELLYLLAMRLKSLGRSKKSEMLLAMSIECGFRSPEALLSRADTFQKAGDDECALDCVWKAFDYENLNREQLGLGVDILRRIDPENLLEIAGTVAFKFLNIDKCIWISSELNWCKQGLQASLDLLSRYYQDPDQSVAMAETVKMLLVLSLVGLGKFQDAVDLFGSTRPTPATLGIVDCFNYAMAEWGLHGEPPEDMFNRVVDLNASSTPRRSANYYQCLAIALWGIGSPHEAILTLKTSSDIMSEEPCADFSCWRYLTVSPDIFQNDCESIKGLIQGDSVKPLCFPD